MERGGPAGETGPVGPKGDAGPEGPTGPQGPAGQSPILTAADDGTLYSDGELLTGAIPAAIGKLPEEVAGQLRELPVIRTDTAQGFSAAEQMQALENAGIRAMALSADELDRPLTDAEYASLTACDLLRISGIPRYGTLWFHRGWRAPADADFNALLNPSVLLRVVVDGATRRIGPVTEMSIRDENAVAYIYNQGKSSAQQAVARTNISAVGYLSLTATLGAEADNWPLALTSTLAEVQAAYALFWAAPGRYRWSLAVHSAAAGNPFVEEAELEPLRRDDGSLELLFTSKRSGLRYAVVLTVEGGAVTGIAVEYRVLPRQAHLSLATVWDTRIRATFNPATGYWEMNGLRDLTVDDMDRIAAYGVQPVAPTGAFMCARIRSAFPVTSAGSQQYDAGFIFSGSEVETLNLQMGATSYYHACDNYRKLRRIEGVIDVGNTRDLVGIALNCVQLEYLPLQNIWGSIDLSTLPRLNTACGIFLIGKARPRSGVTQITITLHPDVYAAWMADAAVREALSAQPVVSLASAGSVTEG